MLDSQIVKMSERRGRFLIQEIENDGEETKLDKFESRIEIISHNEILQKVKETKRPRHSSIIDSKIIHTTRTDSNFLSETFSSLVYVENLKDWVDFDKIWKRFSMFHVDVLENDMEKIFHYIDNRIDDSEFEVNKKIGKELILTNFQGSDIVSPAFSPINCSSKLLYVENIDPLVLDKENLPNSVESNLRVENVTQFTVQKIKKQRLTNNNIEFGIVNTESDCILGNSDKKTNENSDLCRICRNKI